MRKNRKTRLDWKGVIAKAREIVLSYDTGVTLRQLFYRLVSIEVLPNVLWTYNKLSEHTASARRAGTFPDLIDLNREIHVAQSFSGPKDAKEWLKAIYRRDRTEGQAASIYLGVEKRGLVAQLDSWFGDLGIPVVAVSGYSSQTYVDEIARDVERQGRPSVLVYAGDHDPSGEDIDRDFIARTGCWDEVVRVGLDWEQVVAYGLPPQPGKVSDPRAAAFAAKHGRLVQVELDALTPDVLRGLFASEIDARWDGDMYLNVLKRERRERAGL